MAGAKTRFGFSGSGSDPPDAETSRRAQTVIGRDIHLQSPPDLPSPPVAPAPPPAIPSRVRTPPRNPTEPPRSAAPVGVPAEDTEELPSRRRSHAGGSGLARFLGRWTRSGRFVSQSRSGAGNGNLEIPRDPLARNIVVVLVVALVTFSLTLFLVKLRQGVSRNARPSATSAPSVPTAPVPDPPRATPGASPNAAPLPETSPSVSPPHLQASTAHSPAPPAAPTPSVAKPTKSGIGKEPNPPLENQALPPAQ
jgi:hypothetical protein